MRFFFNHFLKLQNLQSGNLHISDRKIERVGIQWNQFNYYDSMLIAILDEILIQHCI